MAMPDHLTYHLTKQISVKKGQKTETHVWHYWLGDDQNIWEANKWSSAHIVLAPWIWQLERSAEWQMTRDLIGNKSQFFPIQELELFQSLKKSIHNVQNFTMGLYIVRKGLLLKGANKAKDYTKSLSPA